MDNKQKYLRLKIAYKQKFKEIEKINLENSKINNGNINMNEDFVFTQSDYVSPMRGINSLSIGDAINDLNKYFENYK